MSLKYGHELLQQIAAGVNQHDRVKVGNLAVVIETDEGGAFEFSLAGALDAIANGLFWDERGDWSGARLAKVKVL